MRKGAATFFVAAPFADIAAAVKAEADQAIQASRTASDNKYTDQANILGQAKATALRDMIRDRAFCPVTSA